DASGLQTVERLFSGLELQFVAAAQDDHLASVLQELLDIRRLDPRLVPRPRLVPIPGPPAARPELEVLGLAHALDRHPPPRERGDLRGHRWFNAGHVRSFAEVTARRPA